MEHVVTLKNHNSNYKSLNYVCIITNISYIYKIFRYYEGFHISYTVRQKH